MKKGWIAMALALALMLCGAGYAQSADGADLVGVYTDVDDGVTRLRVLPDGDAFAVTLDIYRLVGLEFTAEADGGALRGVADIDGDATAVIDIVPGAAGPTATVVESDWGLLEPGTAFAFAPGAPGMDPETFEWLFAERLTGIAGTAGATLKQAEAAADLLSALIRGDAGYCDADGLTAAVAAALESLDAQRRAELDENLIGGVTPLIDGALDGDEAVRGAFEDAGVWDAVAGMARHPLAPADWQAFCEAYARAKE